MIPEVKVIYWFVSNNYKIYILIYDHSNIKLGKQSTINTPTLIH